MKVIIQSSIIRRRIQWNTAARSEPVLFEPGYASLFVPSDFPGAAVGIELMMSDDTRAPLSRDGAAVSVSIVAGSLNVIPLLLMGGPTRFVAATAYTGEGEVVGSSLPFDPVA